MGGRSVQVSDGGGIQCWPYLGDAMADRASASAHTVTRTCQQDVIHHDGIVTTSVENLHIGRAKE
jgi:hypothetical protein